MLDLKVHYEKEKVIDMLTALKTKHIEEYTLAREEYLTQKKEKLTALL